MRKLLVVIGVIALVLALVIGASVATATPTVTFTLLNAPPTHLAVGETYTIDIQVTSDTPFIWAVAMPTSYYPGRGIFFHGSDRASQGTSAVLHLTVTGKNSTADLPAVTDWPTTEDWPAGVAPAAVVVGVRFKNGETVSQWYPFAVTVQ